MSLDPLPPLSFCDDEIETLPTITMTRKRMRVLIRALRTCDYSWDQNRQDIDELRLMINEGNRKP